MCVCICTKELNLYLHLRYNEIAMHDVQIKPAA